MTINSRHQRKRERKRAMREIRSKQKQKERRKNNAKLLFSISKARFLDKEEKEKAASFPEVFDLGPGKDLTQVKKILPKGKSFETQKGNK